jgi:hypothetical protein
MMFFLTNAVKPVLAKQRQMYVAVHVKLTMHDMGMYDADVYCVIMQIVDMPRVKNNKI